MKRFLSLLILFCGIQTLLGPDRLEEKKKQDSDFIIIKLSDDWKRLTKPDYEPFELRVWWGADRQTFTGLTIEELCIGKTVQVNRNTAFFVGLSYKATKQQLTVFVASPGYSYTIKSTNDIVKIKIDG